MNHYPRHVGDWITATAHLTEVEECIYSRMVDQYYAREAPLPAEPEAVARLVRAATPIAKKAVRTVLSEFFELQDDGWHQKRCDEEIAAFILKAAKASASATARWGNRNANASPNAMRTHMRSDMRTQSEGNATQNQNHNHGVAAVVDADRAGAPEAENRMGDKSPGKSRSKARWWTSDDGVMAHGSEVGIPARAGESMAEYKDRLLKAQHARR